MVYVILPATAALRTLVSVLVAALALPATLATPACALALALLCGSFGRDVVLLFLGRRPASP